MTMTTERPRRVYISRTAESRELYRAEEQRGEIMRTCATEWLNLMGMPTDRDTLYDVGIPQMLFDMLDNYGPHIARLACEAWLEQHPEEA